MLHTLDAPAVRTWCQLALRALGQRPPAELAQASASEALAWGVAHWDATRIPRCATLPEERL